MQAVANLHVEEGVDEACLGTEQVVLHIASLLRQSARQKQTCAAMHAPEAPQRYTRLGEKHKPRHRAVQKRGGEQPPLCGHHAHLSPLDYNRRRNRASVEHRRGNSGRVQLKARSGVDVDDVLAFMPAKEALPEPSVRQRAPSQKQERDAWACARGRTTSRCCQRSRTQRHPRGTRVRRRRRCAVILLPSNVVVLSLIISKAMCDVINIAGSSIGARNRSSSSRIRVC